MKHLVKQEEFIRPADTPIKGYWREDTSDRNTLLSCIVEDEYRLLKTKHEVGLVIDLGSHIGAFTMAAVSLGFNVIAAEMLPENNHMFWANMIANNFQDQIKLYEGAVVGKMPPIIKAYYSDTSTESGKVHEFIGTIVQRAKMIPLMTDGKEIVVPTYSLESIFTENKIERVTLMKADIEGAEWEMFENTPKEIINKIDRIAIELDGRDGKPTSTTEFLKLLGDQFIDYSPTYFPDWCKPGTWCHGYYCHKRIL